jgi:hypothetical protein
MNIKYDVSFYSPALLLNNAGVLFKVKEVKGFIVHVADIFDMRSKTKVIDDVACH